MTAPLPPQPEDSPVTISTQAATGWGIFAMMTWAFAPLLLAALGSVPPLQIIVVDFTIAALILIGKWVVCQEGVLRHFRLPWYLWLLGLGLFGFHFCYFFAFQHAPAVEAFLLIESWPLMMLFVAIPLLGERLRWYHAVGAFVGFAGMVLVVTEGKLSGFSSHHTKGYLLAIGAAIIWAMYSAFSRKWAAQMPGQIIGVYCLMTAVLAVPFHLAFETWQPLTLEQWQLLFIIGLGPTGLSFLTWNVGMKHGNVHLLSILALGVPIAGAALLIAFGYNDFTSHVALAAILVVAGAAIGSGVWKRKQNASHK